MKSRLFKCISCKTILPWYHRQQLRCLSKNAELDNRGNVKWKHTVDTNWEFAVGQNNELSKMINQNIKLVYWKIWGLSHIFTCSVCNQVVQVGPTSDTTRIIFGYYQTVFIAVLAEWLRRVIRNHLGSPRVGSNPADSA